MEEKRTRPNARPQIHVQPGPPPSSVVVMAGAKYALVTGGNRGIGLEVCKQLLAKGKPVLFTARNAAQGGNARGISVSKATWAEASV